MALFLRLKNEISPINKIIKSNVILLNSRALSQIAKKDSNQIEPLKKKPDWLPEDKVTHTGQKFDENDKRLARFIGKEKQVNTRFAIDLIAEVPPTSCKERIVSCDGGGGPLGHPKVFINLDIPGNHSCGYCGLRFYKEDHH